MIARRDARFRLANREKVETTQNRLQTKKALNEIKISVGNASCQED